MKVKVTEKGINWVVGGKDQEVPVGTFIEVKGDDVPKALLNKVQIIEETEATEIVTNEGATTQSAYSLLEKDRGWLVIMKDGVEVSKNFRATELAGFEVLTEEEKAAFVAANPKEA